MPSRGRYSPADAGEQGGLRVGQRGPARGFRANRPGEAAAAEPKSLHVFRVHFRGNRKVEDDAIKVTLRTQAGVTLTQDMLPLVGPVPGRHGIWVAAGYSGHGNVLGFACGELVADAIRGDPSKLDVFAALPAPRFPGGKLLRKPALVAGMLWYALRDRL